MRIGGKSVTRIIPLIGLLIFGQGWIEMTYAQSEGPRTRAEATNYEETSRYLDVVAFVDALGRGSSILHMESFGETVEGRSLPLMVLADPPITQPRDLLRSGKPAVFVMANIHGGEVEGKEAILQLARRIVSGDLRLILDDIVVLIAPIYNADGNEKFSLENRSRQNGPIGGVGTRENAAGLDLNRDYMKMESPEARSLIGLFNRWDSNVIVDLHTTNGSYHGYHLTYSPPLTPNADPRLIAFERQELLPAVTETLERKHGIRAYYYGNFSRPPGSNEDVASGNRVWQTFDHRPRFGNSYAGLRNRIAILSEAFSYVDFAGRVSATAAFVEEILRFTAGHADEIVALTRSLDDAAVRRGLTSDSDRMGVRFETEASPGPVSILIGEVRPRTNPRSGREMTAVIPDRFTPESMIEYGTFRPTRTALVPRAYLFRPEPALAEITDRLIAHGLTVQEAVEAFTVEAQVFRINEVDRATRPFEGHLTMRIEGQTVGEQTDFPAGTIIVRTAQPLAALAFYLLEPESDDGLVNWNFLDDYLEVGGTYPIYKLTTDVTVATRTKR